MGKGWIKGLLIVVVLGVIFIGAKDMIAKAAVEGACKVATGLDLKMGRLGFGLLSGKISVNDLTLFNPAEFKDRIMMRLPEVFVNFDMGSIFKDKKHVRKLKIYLAELSVIRNEKGRLNLNALKPAGSGSKGPKGAPQKMPPVAIDEFYLRIDDVVYKDYTTGITQKFSLGIEETYRDVQDIRAIAPILIGKALANAELRMLANFKVDDLLQNFQASGVDVSSLGLDKIQGIGIGFTKQIQGAMIKVPKMSETAEKTLKDVTTFFGGLTEKK